MHYREDAINVAVGATYWHRWRLQSPGALTGCRSLFGRVEHRSTCLAICTHAMDKMRLHGKGEHGEPGMEPRNRSGL